MLVVALVALHALLGWSSLLGVAVIGLFWPLGYLLGVKGKAAAARIQQERDRRALLVFVVSQNGQRRYAALEMPSQEADE